MGLCLEADYKPPAVERPAGIFAIVQAAPKKSLRLYGLAPSPLRAHLWIINNPGWLPIGASCWHLEIAGGYFAGRCIDSRPRGAGW